jgi:hypothetical protein
VAPHRFVAFPIFTLIHVYLCIYHDYVEGRGTLSSIVGDGSLRGMMNSRTSKGKLLILGIGNVLMGDEGVGVHVVNAEVEKSDLPADVDCLDGGTGSFLLLETDAERREGDPDRRHASMVPKAGQFESLTPKYSKDYPKTLTAHDIGLKIFSTRFI